ncbi:hypothetical protein [Micromonospora globbae]|uniref:hypothetical protein n=1 Tax=Micromonospora globbae TaxID=1894969 RepID=UPI00341473F1
MPDADCTACPDLRAQLAAAAAGLRGLAQFIESELVEPTMPWRDLLPVLAIRAHNLADQAQGR